MHKPRGGWDARAGRPKPAADYQIKYGHGLLEQESSTWPQYVVVSTPSAKRAAAGHFSKPSLGTALVSSLDWSHLDRAAECLPSSDLVVGLGGGLALDASKYIALKRDLPLVLVPTVVSTGAIIHGHVAKWDGYQILGNGDDWPWRDFEDILVDYDIVLKAPARLNTAGLGDVLCGFAGIAEWFHNANLGIGEPFDEAAVAQTAGHHRLIVKEFPNTLGPNGALTSKSIHFIMTAIQERDRKALRHPAAISADHSLWMAMEEINERRYVHGEAVALCAAIIAWHCGENPGLLPCWLDTCKVGWRPKDAKVSKQDLRKALAFAPTYFSNESAGRDIPSILLKKPIIGKKFLDLWDFLSN